jgi:heme-degrading monooxygenase HmoA
LASKEAVMFARVLISQPETPATPAQVEELLRLIQEKNLPLMKQQKGFKSCYVLGAPDNAKSLIISFWETEADARGASTELDALRRQQREQDPALARVTSGGDVDIYEVRLQA